MNISTLPTAVRQAIDAACEILATFAEDETFEEKIEIAFGNDFDSQKLSSLRQEWRSSNFLGLPTIEILPSATLNGAEGAYSIDTNTIYLSQDLIDRNADDVPAIAHVVLEEIGHSVDAYINPFDASGDEGAIFSTLVQNTILGQFELQILKSENDYSTIVYREKDIQIEQATGKTTSGVEITSIELGEEAVNAPFTFIPVGDFTVDGNQVKVTATLKNLNPNSQINIIVGAKKVGSNNFQDLNKPLDLDIPIDVPKIISIPANGEQRVEFLWNTRGYAWNPNNTPASNRIIQVFAQETVPSSSDGFKLASKNEPIKIIPKPVVLVHGLASNASTWIQYVNTSSPSFNASGFLGQANPDWLGFAVDNLDTGDSIFSYRPVKTTQQNAFALNTYIEDVVRKPLNAQHIDIVAHSQGGLISRQYIQAFMPFPVSTGGVLVGEPIVSHLIMLGTPNSGSEIATLGSVALFPAIQELTVPFVTKIFNNRVNARKGVQFSAIAGNQEGVIPTDGVVTTFSALNIQRELPPKSQSVPKIVVEAIKDSVQFTVLHTGMPPSEDIFKGFVLPRLALDPTEIPLIPAQSSFQSAQSNNSRSQDPIPLDSKIKAKAVDQQSASAFQVFFINAPALVANGSTEVVIPASVGSNLDITHIASSSVSATLLDSTGAVIGQTLAGTPEANQLFRGFRINAPSGSYRLRLEQQGGVPNVVPVIAAIEGSPLILSVNSQQSNNQDRLQVIAALNNAGSPLTAAVVSATIAGIDGSQTSILLFDDGTHEDSQANDGIYGGWLDSPKPDDYNIFVSAQGLDAQGSAFQRIASDAVTIVNRRNPSSYTGTNLSALVSGLESLFSSIQTAINTQIFSKKLPILGDQLNGAVLLQDLWKADVFSSTALTLDNIAAKLEEATGGLVTLVSENEGEIRFQLNLISVKTFRERLIASDVGVSEVGLNVKGNANTDLNFNFDLDFGIRKDTGFFLDTSKTNEFQLGLNSSLSSLESSASLGLLKLNVQNNGTALRGNFALDLQDSNRDNQVTLSEINPFLNASANIGLKAKTTFNESTVLPSFNFDFNVGLADVFTGSSPQIAFNNVELGLGSFAQQFAKPILQNINSVVDPIRPLLNGLTSNIDFLTNDLPNGLGLRGVLDVEQEVTPGDVTLLDILKIIDVIKPISGFNQSLKFIKAAREVTQLVDTISTITSANAINLGYFSYLLNNPKGAITSPNSLDALSSQIRTLAPNLNSSLLNFGGLQFPILSNPLESFNLIQQLALPKVALSNLILGRASNLFLYDMPALELSVNNVNLPLPVIPPLFAKIGLEEFKARMDFAFGYDTEGIAAALGGGGLFNGFYVSDRANPDGTGDDVDEVSLLGDFGAKLSLDFGVGELTGGGIIRTQAGFNLDDPNEDGKVRIDELKPPFFDDMSGRISAFLRAEARLAVGAEIVKKLLTDPVYLINPVAGVLKDLAKEVGWLNDIGEFVGRTVKKIVNFVESIPVLGDVISEVREVFEEDESKPSDVLFRIDSPEVILWDFQTGSGGSNSGSSKSLIGDDNDNTLNGTPGNDEMSGRAGNDLLDGKEGNDKLYGEADNDTLYGGSGKDFLDGGDGDDRLFGDAGDDILNGSAGNDELFGGDDADLLKGNEGNDLIVGDAGDDTLLGGLGSDTLNGIDGNDKLSGEEGEDALDGGSGDDQLSGGDAVDKLFGGAGEDVLDGGVGDDQLEGGEGNDQLFGGDGNDQMLGNMGNDLLNGGNDNDILMGGGENDSLVGEEGDDQLFGETGNDTLNGGNGNDVLIGGEGDDQLLGETGDDRLEGGEGDDQLLGSAGRDTLLGDAGDDSLFGEDGDDWLEGGNGKDSLIGGEGNDTLLGQEGDDTLVGGLSNDILNGGLGNDRLAGQDGDDQLSGDAGNDLLSGESGNDLLLGGDGTDTLIGGTGSDLLNGSDGTDMASYITALSGIIANISNPQANTGDAQGDIYISIEYLEGSQFNDVLTGNGQNNHIWGLGGNDYLNGLGGSAILEGGLDNDTYRIDNLVTQIIESLNQGIDTVDASIDYTLGANSNLENLNLLEGTSALNGTGNELSNIIQGNSARNTLNGGDGDDRLIGGRGADILTGGIGSDTFAYTNITDAGDMLMDFTAGVDKIEIKEVLKNNTSYRGTKPIEDGYLSVRQVNAGLTSIQIDPDGFGNFFRPAPFILLKNVQASSLDINSFVI